MEMLLNMNPSETFNCSAVSYIKQNTIGNHELLKCHIIHPEVELRVFSEAHGLFCKPEQQYQVMFRAAV